MKYATSDNFLNAKVYDCAVNILRPVKALLQANKSLLVKVYGSNCLIAIVR
jgi:hypothetical protein